MMIYGGENRRIIKVFGQDIAVLAGDALLTEAFGWLAKTKAYAQKNVLLW